MVTKKSVKKNSKEIVSKSERKEAFFRIIVAIVSGIILYLWYYAVAVLILINWLIVVFSGRKSMPIAKFCGFWTREVSRFIGYLSFASEERPFPFNELED